jgi:hypothetical protein
MKNTPSPRTVLGIICGAALLGASVWWAGPEIHSVPFVAKKTSAADVQETSASPDETSAANSAASSSPKKALFVTAGPTKGERLVINPSKNHQVGRETPVDTASFRSLLTVTEGDTVTLPIAEGEQVQGTVNLVKQDNGFLRVAGSVRGPRGGSFAVSISGEMVAGLIQLYGPQIAYRIEQPAPGEAILKEVPRREVVCLPLPRMQEPVLQRAPRGAAEVPPILNSRPTAVHQLYLDFDGETVNDPDWNNGQTIVAPPPSVTNAEITQIFNRVKEDFWPFNINVTTEVTRYNSAPVGKRMRCIITPNDAAAPGAGGVAYLDSFARAGSGFSSTIPCWVFNTSVIGIAEAISHELGHTFGLLHDGRELPSGHEEYYLGHGSGPTSWCPIMGAGYYVSLVQWSKGEYANANNQEDDVAIISNAVNSFGYIADEAGGTRAQAANLTFTTGGVISQAGIITAAADEDFYSFTTTGGNATITATPATLSPNLDIRIELQDSTGVVVGSSNPIGALNGAITANIPAGGYFIRIRGTGEGQVLGTGYSNYGSIGLYTLTGTIPGGRSGPPVITSPASVTVEINQQLDYQITATNDPDSYNVTGALPAGVTFNASTALISGIPTEIGTFPIVVSATNPVGTGTKNVSIIVIPTPPPNLHTVKPAGWDDNIVISTVTGDHTNAAVIESDDNVYMDFAVTNDGSLPTEVPFVCDLLIDGQLRATFPIPFPFDVGATTEVNDIDVGTLSIGQHTVQVKVDSGNTVVEIDETDNDYQRSVTAIVPQLPNIIPFKPASWTDRVVVSNVQGTSTDSAVLRTDNTLYVDVAVVNDGPVTATDTFTTMVFLDGQLFTTFTTDPPLAQNIVGFKTDINIGQLDSGLHTIRVRTDSDLNITEVSELDNDYLKPFFVQPAGAANLGFFKPSGWSGSVVVSRVSGTRTDTQTVTTADNLYVDFTALSNGTLTINQPWTAKVFVDDVDTASVNFTSSLPPNFTVEGDDLSIGKLSAGQHTIRVVLDAANSVGETNETPNDNEVTRVINVIAPPTSPGPAVYSGVIRAANGTPALDKFGLASVKVSSGGGFTAKLSSGPNKFSVKGALDGSGESAFGKGNSSTATALLNRKGASPLQLDFRIAGSAGKEQLQGELTDNGLAFASFTADRAIYSSKSPAPPLLVGKFTALFPAKSPGDQGLAANLYPQGFGIGFVTVSKDGMAKFEGTLADGSKFTFSNPIVADNQLPFHLLVSKGTEIVNGTIAFREQTGISDFDASDLVWIKLQELSSPSYTGGWPQGIKVDVIGSKYTRAKGQSALPWLGAVTGAGNAQVKFTGAGLTSAQTASVNVDPKGKVAVVNSAVPGLKLSLSTKTGSLTGEFQHPVSGAKTKFYGAAFDLQSVANGFFLNQLQSGAQTLTPAP